MLLHGLWRAHACHMQGMWHPEATRGKPQETRKTDSSSNNNNNSEKEGGS